MDNREKILEATIKVFKTKGLKFTMDDIARELSMSKKTIYTVFKDKESMLLAMVDYCFDNIKRSEKETISDNNLTTEVKLRRLLAAMPESYRDIEFNGLYQIKEKYPSTYIEIEKRLETGWEQTIELINKGIDEGVFRPVNTAIFKTMMEATLEQFFQRDILVKNNISYKKALEEVVDILVDGIVVTSLQIKSQG